MTTAAHTVDPTEERLHTATVDPLWSESFYLNFSDTTGGLGGFTRIALHPARPETEGLLCLYLPGGGVGIVRLVDSLEQPDDRAVRARGLAHECVAPLQRWRVRYDGDVHVFADPALVPSALLPDAPATLTRQVQLDLDVTGLHAPFFYPTYRKAKAGPPHHTNGRIGLRDR